MSNQGVSVLLSNGSFLFFEDGAGWDFSPGSGVDGIVIWGSLEEDVDGDSAQPVLAEFVNNQVTGAVFGQVVNHDGTGGPEVRTKEEANALGGPNRSGE